MANRMRAGGGVYPKKSGWIESYASPTNWRARSSGELYETGFIGTNNPSKGGDMGRAEKRKRGRGRGIRRGNKGKGAPPPAPRTRMRWPDRRNAESARNLQNEGRPRENNRGANHAVQWDEKWTAKAKTGFGACDGRGIGDECAKKAPAALHSITVSQEIGG